MVDTCAGIGAANPDLFSITLNPAASNSFWYLVAVPTKAGGIVSRIFVFIGPTVVFLQAPPRNLELRRPVCAQRKYNPSLLRTRRASLKCNNRAFRVRIKWIESIFRARSKEESAKGRTLDISANINSDFACSLLDRSKARPRAAADVSIPRTRYPRLARNNASRPSPHPNSTTLAPCLSLFRDTNSTSVEVGSNESRNFTPERYETLYFWS